MTDQKNIQKIADLIKKNYSEQERITLSNEILPNGYRIIRSAAPEPVASNQGETRNHFYRNVPKLGNVAVSRHAQASMIEDGISQDSFDATLLSPSKPDIQDGADVVWRERDGLRLVILMNPTPNTGARLVKTVYRIERQAKAK